MLSISTQEVAMALRKNNIELPTGKLTTQDRSWYIKTSARLKTENVNQIRIQTICIKNK